MGKQYDLRDALKTFKRLEKMLKKGSNNRNMMLSVDEAEKMKAVNCMDEMVNNNRVKSAGVDQKVDQATKKGLK
ncbi:MAG: hypothetical protein GY737_11260 [Desulfobacteraceae bacterium]|nr:hypothetical protein [Desulfobacteraceae bacterium]